MLLVNQYNPISLVAAILNIIGSIITGCIAVQLFKHLHRITHNWANFSPSKWNRFYAVSSVALLSIARFTYFVVYLVCRTSLSAQTKFLWTIIPDILLVLGHTFYYLYLATTLRYHITADPGMLMPAISMKLIKFIEALAFVMLISYFVYFYLYYITNASRYIDGIPDISIFFIWLFVAKVILIEIAILYSYYCGVKRIAQYHYVSVDVQEYGSDSNGKINELLTKMARGTVGVVTSSIATFVSVIVIIIVYYVHWNNDNWQYVFAHSAMYLVQVIDDITFGLSVYLIYPFAYHDFYLKICGKCHRSMYRLCNINM